MSDKFLGFKSKQEKYIFFGIVGALILIIVISIHPNIKGYVNDYVNANGKIAGDAINQKGVEVVQPMLSKKEYYDMFQCSCCGKSIARGCCGMAKQRKNYVDELLLEGIEGNGLVYEMVKKFGFDVLMNQSKEQEIRDYILSQASENPPKIEIEPSVYDFGTISQEDGMISTSFTITNTGKSDLIIENIDTSCGCTSASIVYNGRESPRFSMSMHGTNPKDFALSIPPGDTAQLNVYYDPNAHGTQKKPSMDIVRYVTVISNDPVDFQIKVRIKLTQVILEQ